MATIHNTIQKYNIWSNFMYFVAGTYSISIGIFLHAHPSNELVYIPTPISFGLMGTLLYTVGITSCIYHSHKQEVPNGGIEHFAQLSNTDTYLSLATFIYGFLFLCMRIAITGNILKILKDPVLYITLLLGIISIVFYTMARVYDNRALFVCESLDCIQDNMLTYDVFHSNWHLFTGMTALFAITLIKHTF